MDRIGLSSGIKALTRDLLRTWNGICSVGELLLRS